MEDIQAAEAQVRGAPEPEAQPPAKRARVDPPTRESGNSGAVSFSEAVQTQQQSADKNTQPEIEQRRKEIEAGITTFVSPKGDAGGGFTGVLKQRYTDFQVNEILPDGRVCHLRSLQPPKRKQAEEDKPGANETQILQQPVEPDPNVQVDEVSTAEAPADKNAIPQDAQENIIKVFGKDSFASLESLYHALVANPQKKPRDFRHVRLEPLQDRQLRTEGHQAIRKAFSSRLESTTDGDGSIKVSPAPLSNKGRGGDNQNPKRIGKPAWHELGGEYLHFTVYKENKDTMEIVSSLASQLKVAPKAFQFGGTKDRRAVTSQRVSAYRIHAEQMASMNKRLRQAKVGDFEYHPTPLGLGDTNGNEFQIALRNCYFPGTEGMDAESKIKLAQANLSKYVSDFETRGFINYYGLQRFGSFSTSTSTVGTLLLRGDFAGAVAAILEYSATSLSAAQDESGAFDSMKISEADKSRALGIHMWETTQDSRKALEIIQKRFSAEVNLIRHLGQFDKQSRQLRHPQDFLGALQTIPRNLRLMYVHAYQSLVWNHIAGHRWQLYGDKVVEGDLVLVHEQNNKTDVANSTESDPDVDEAGEPIIRPATDDTAVKPDDFERARHLSAADAASGAYTIFDIVLPLPGFDVEYPKNLVGEEYKIFMASERGGGLDPYDMRRKWKDLSLSGSYRKVLARPKQRVEGTVKVYTAEDEQLVTTDGDLLQEGTARNGQAKSHIPATETHSSVMQASDDDTATPTNGQKPEFKGPNAQHDGSTTNQDRTSSEKDRLAVILKMQLGPSTYATMALRELLGEGGVDHYKPDFGGGR